MARTKGLQIRLTQEELVKIAESANRGKRSISDWARWTLLNAAEGIHVSPLREWPATPDIINSVPIAPSVFVAMESTAKGVMDRPQTNSERIAALRKGRS